MRTRRQVVGALGASALAGLSARSAFAQQTVDGWPQRTVRVISPTATGGKSGRPRKRHETSPGRHRSLPTVRFSLSGKHA